MYKEEYAGIIHIDGQSRTARGWSRGSRVKIHFQKPPFKRFPTKFCLRSQGGSPKARDVKFARKFFQAYLATYLENYKSDRNLKSIKTQYNYFVIEYSI